MAGRWAEAGRELLFHIWRIAGVWEGEGVWKIGVPVGKTGVVYQTNISK